MATNEAHRDRVIGGQYKVTQGHRWPSRTLFLRTGSVTEKATAFQLQLSLDCIGRSTESAKSVNSGTSTS